MDEDKARAYAELAARMEELHASVARLADNVDRMARSDAEAAAMTRIFHGVCVFFSLANFLAGTNGALVLGRFRNAAEQAQRADRRA